MVRYFKGNFDFFVVLSHSYPRELYRNFFTPVFLTMFFFALGYTFSLKRNFKMFLKSKFKRLICPFLCLVHHFTTYTNESIVAESIVSMLS